MGKIIKTGMYVRTKKGIAKVTRLCGLDNVAWTDKKDIFFGINRLTGCLDFEVYDDGTVIGEPSYEVMDLLEVGDYVNGTKIGYIDDFKGYMRQFYYEYENPERNCGHWLDEIETIVPREVFKEWEYKIGE